MHTNGVLKSRDIAALRQIRAEIGRRLKIAYEPEEPLPDRLAELVRKIAELPERHFQQAQRPPNRATPKRATRSVIPQER